MRLPRLHPYRRLPTSFVVQVLVAQGFHVPQHQFASLQGQLGNLAGGRLSYLRGVVANPTWRPPGAPQRHRLPLLGERLVDRFVNTTTSRQRGKSNDT